mgnify:CR=1 FL=1
MFEKLAEQSLALMGWKTDNQWPEHLDQCVMIAAPHTSNWDALYARLALKALGVNVRLTIKDSYMKLPFGPFVRAMGGIGINRRPKNEGEARPSMVELMTDLFKIHPKLVMLVTPEGTRSKQEQWKTGFYHVAVKAGVPIAIGYIPIALAFGILARSYDIDVYIAALMSAVIFAGASQFIGINLLAMGASCGEIVITTFLLNLKNQMIKTFEIYTT